MSDLYAAQTMNTMIYEILAHANNLLKQDKAKGIEYLTKNRSRVVIEGLLKMNYDPAVMFLLPAGEAPFKKNKDVPDGYCLTDLKQEFRRFRIFTDPNLNITRVRREQLWLQMCEGLFWKEADLIHKIKDRRITDMYDQFTAENVREIFPNLLPEVVAAPVPIEKILPVDFGPDPSLISEEELIKESLRVLVVDDLQGNDGTEIQAVDDFGNKYEPDTTTPVVDDFSKFKESNEYQEFLEFKKFQEYQAKKAQAGVMGETSASTQTPQRKKPGPKPKAQVVDTTTKVRQKPGPKPKPKGQETEPKQRKKPGPKPRSQAS